MIEENPNTDPKVIEEAFRQQESPDWKAKQEQVKKRLLENPNILGRMIGSMPQVQVTFTDKAKRDLKWSRRKLWLVSRFHPFKKSRDAAKLALMLIDGFQRGQRDYQIYQNLIDMGNKYAKQKQGESK